MPLIPKIVKPGEYEMVAPSAVVVRCGAEEHDLMPAANLFGAAVERLTIRPGSVIWEEGEFADGRLHPWTVLWWVARPSRRVPPG
jgi:hypothetical protein